MSETTLCFDRVSKEYRLGQIGYSSLREDIANLFRKKARTAKCFLALDEVSFEVGRGEAVGIIGPNGAGKSTILKLLSGVTIPSGGKVQTTGKIGALIELSAGFHPELTGRENIFLYGSIIGMTNAYVARQFREIVDFSGIEQFIDTPVKRYSSGMYARLGFSVSVHLDPDVLLVDEVLSVGDSSFQAKCIAKMSEFRDSGKTIVYVSHNLESVRKLCPRVILLQQGQISYDGNAEEALRRYYHHFSASQRGSRSSSETIRLVEKDLTDASSSPRTTVRSSEQIHIRLRFEAGVELENVFFAAFVRHSNGLVVYDTSSDLLNGTNYSIQGGRTATVDFTMRCNLLKGTYMVGCNVYASVDGLVRECVFYENTLFTIDVTESISHQGVANLDAQCAVDIDSTP
ncbi:ABC transporter ATP-binding protein [Elusimicrobiota bacterium]